MQNKFIRFTVLTLLLIGIFVIGFALGNNNSSSSNEASTLSEESLIAQSQNVEGAVRIEVGADIQAIVDSHSTGTTFILASGIHRMQTITPRDNDVFIGEIGAVLSGARLLVQFEADEDYWVADEQTQEGRRVHDSCQPMHTLCHYPEDLFIDDEPLLQVRSLEDVMPGTWYFDYDDDRIYTLDNPNGRIAEISVSATAFDGDASNVTIRNLTIEKYANPAQLGAIHGDDTTDWLVDNVTVRLNHGTGIRLGNGIQILNSIVLRNGQLGVGGVGAGIRVEGNEIAYNNYAGYRSTWEAGGTKFVSTTDLIVRNNYVHHNDGPGLWSDFDNHNVLYENNLVTYNQRIGIYHEISGAAIIRNNIVQFNGLNYDNWHWGSQILVATSSDVEVYENQVVVDAQIGNGIGVINQDRLPWQAYNNYVHDNVILHLGASGMNGVATDFDNEQFWAESNNRFEGNTYYVVSEDTDFWSWNDDRLDWEEFQAQAQEANGIRIIGDIPDDLWRVPDSMFTAAGS